MNGLPLAKDILSLPSQVLLLAAFGISLLLAIRRGDGLGASFESYAVGYLVILFYASGLRGLFSLGKELDLFLAQLGNQDGLREFVAKSLADSTPHFGNGIAGGAKEIANYIGQIFRTGVWGVVTSLTELIFLLARFLLEVSRDVLWQILFILFPLGAAFFPLFPRVLANMCILALELVLWMPLLTIVNAATSLLARQYSRLSSDIGFYVIACELVAIIMTFSIPEFVHRLVSGSVSGTMLSSWARTIALAGAFATRGLAVKRRGIDAAKGGLDYIRRKRNGGAAALAFLFLSTNALAVETVSIPFGYVTKLSCKGRLLISAIGDERLLELSALPKEIGCGVLLRPKQPGGHTNLILETSGGTIHRLLSVSKQAPQKSEIELEK
jgi:hypothetical protein